MTERTERRMDAVVSTALQAVDDYVPEELPVNDADAPLAFALSAIRRMADLVDAELTLALAERHSVTRPLGRPVIELWLYANDLLLDGDAALERLFAEDAGHQSRLEHGRQVIWDRLESKRAGGIDPRSPNVCCHLLQGARGGSVPPSPTEHRISVPIFYIDPSIRS